MFINDKIIVKYMIYTPNINNINMIIINMFNNELNNGKNKLVMRMLCEYNYSTELLYTLVNYYYKNKNINSINDNIIYKIKNDNVIGKIYYLIGTQYKVDNNINEMIKYYLLAINCKNDMAANNLGGYYLENKLYNDAEKYLLIAIKYNNHQAIHNITSLYLVINNYDKMKHYALLAFTKFNCAKGLHNIGFYYQTIEKDYNKMKKYYLMAIKNKYFCSLYNLAIFYEHTNKNFNNMIKYYKLACDNGCITSMFRLAVSYYIIKDYTNMEFYCKKAINLVNHADAWFLYGIYYYNIKKNTQIGIEMLKKAANFGCHRANLQLGLFAYKNTEYNEMFIYYKISLLNKIYNTYFYMAIYYDTVENDTKTAFKYAQLAINNEISIAYLYLAKYYLFDQVDIELCKQNLDKLFYYFSDVNIIFKLKHTFSKQILCELFSIYDGNNIEVINKINNYIK